MFGAGLGEKGKVPDETTGAASDFSSSSGSGSGARTRGDLQRLVNSAVNPLEVKTELMDTASLGGDSDAINYDYNDDEVFCYEKNTIATNISKSTASASVSNFQAKSDCSKDVTHFLGRGYIAVRAARRAASSPRQLNPNPNRTESVSIGTFASTKDARLLRTKVLCNLTTRTVITCSFDPASLRCVSCVGGGHDAAADAGGGPIAMVIADQAFPPCLPVGRGGGNVCAWCGSRMRLCAS